MMNNVTYEITKMPDVIPSRRDSLYEPAISRCTRAMNRRLSPRNRRLEALLAHALALPTRPPTPFLLRRPWPRLRALNVSEMLGNLLRLLELLLDFSRALAEKHLKERGVARVGFEDSEHDVAGDGNEADRCGDKVVGKHLVVYVFGYPDGTCV